MSDNEKGWKDIPIGGLIVEPGNSETYDTGSWRTYVPVLDKEKCINCLRCWILCPDNAVIVKDGKNEGYDLMHCKGCGVCAHECPPKIKAITMVLDTDREKEADK